MKLESVFGAFGIFVRNFERNVKNQFENLSLENYNFVSFLKMMKQSLQAARSIVLIHE